MVPSERVAIVGIGGIFPGSLDLNQFWSNVVRGIDCTRTPPGGRWGLDVDDAYEAKIAAPDRVYSTRGGFIEGFSFDAEGLDVDRDVLADLDSAFHLALHAGRQAWRDAVTDTIDRRRVGVVLGNIVLPSEKTSALADETLGRTIEEQLGIRRDGPVATEPLNVYVAGLPAGLLAQALGLKGGAYTLDAACASSLYAVKLAADELLSGRADAMLTGGLSRPDPLYTQMGFSQLRALSVCGKASPFDTQADGLVVGEGAGMFVLKRLSDALRDGDTVYGVIAGVGLSNDMHGGLLAPSSEGQLRAMRAAYEQAGWNPRDIDLIQCHATGTPVGDSVEFESLRTLWGEAGWSPGQCVLGSVKSNIGHTLTASGSAGLIAALFAMKHAQYPPTANYHAPPATMNVAGSPFRILTEAEPWSRRDGRPRRAAVSAFGFGGINAHLLLEEWTTPPANPDRPRSVRPSAAVGAASDDESVPIAIVGMSAHIGPFAGLKTFQERVLGRRDDRRPTPPERWWGIERSAWFRQHHRTDAAKSLLAIEQLELKLDRFRIPPRELEEMLPQQLLMLSVAGDAIDDAGWDDQPRLRTGVFIGIELDLNTTNFHVRWSLLNKARAWNDQLGLGLSADDVSRWIESLRNSAGPPLTANRTMGALGGLVASRIAREFKVGGPSFTISSQATSGLHALAIAVKMLRRRELDDAIVGAVDFACDVRSVLATRGADGIPADGAAALILKRLDDAVRDGDRIYAVVRGVGAAGGPVGDDAGDPAADRSSLERALDEAGVSLANVGYLDSTLPDQELEAVAALARHEETALGCAIGSARADIGCPGAALGLAALVKTALCLHQRILPPLRDGGSRSPNMPATGGVALFRPAAPQYWLHDRLKGPRTAVVGTSSVDGNSLHVVLGAAESPVASTRRPDAQPLGPRSVAVFVVEAADRAIALRELQNLERLVAERGDAPIENLARQWWRAHPNDSARPLGLAIVADSVDSLRMRLAGARRRLETSAPTSGERGVYVSPDPSECAPFDLGSGVAFVYPGVGNQFPGMGRELSAQWPEILRAHEAENALLGSQLKPGTFWNAAPPDAFTDHRAPILGQVAFGTIVTDLMRMLGVVPTAAIGYSLGESAALFALRAWTDRDEMLRRLHASTLFRSDLAGRCDAARREWSLPPEEPVRWTACVVPRPAEEVRAAISGKPRVYLLIVNSPRECVIGGDRDAVEQVVGELGCSFVPLPIVSTVHCAIARQVEDDYRALHDLPTQAPAGVRFYSGGWRRSYAVDRESAAAAIVAQAVEGVDFNAVIDQAYADGIRVFVEIGPGGSCTRMIGAILEGRPHLALAASLPGQSEVATVLDVLARLVAERVPVNLGALYGEDDGCERCTDARPAAGRTLRIKIGGEPFRVPTAPAPASSPRRQPVNDSRGNGRARPAAAAQPPAVVPSALDWNPLTSQVVARETANAEAHEAFLRASASIAETLSNQLAFQMALIESLAAGPAVLAEAAAVAPAPMLDRDQCLEFAVGSIGGVLGEAFAEIDAHPTRVRLPDEPLMLVDRIMVIEGEKRSLGSGRVVTEHDILPGAWYLDGGRIPTCIAVESGQADLFLSGYLGIDFVTKGLAVYRLLDAAVTFHRGLPGPGEVIRYDIHIDHFFRQGDTHLFRFHFEATVRGEPLLSMRDGCAGFFTAEALAAGKGVIQTALQLRPVRAIKPDDWEELVPLDDESYDEGRVDALREGNLAGAFGLNFEGIRLADSIRLPAGRMRLVDRVTRFQPAGGRFGLGIIRAEADIDPHAWFLTCHFVDDRVMPGTLMYECCLHTLRIALMRMGWVSEHEEAAWEPVPGVASRLKCRGQVTEATRVATYEVSIKELGYRPEPYAIADALMYADGKPIVEITDMSIRLTGQTLARLREIWAARNAVPHPVSARVLFNREQIVEFAIGSPSKAFGDRYRPFDHDRFIARLPAPPFSFLDRITSVNAEPWTMVAGGDVVAEYDVPPNAWYFEADRQEEMPFAVLNEVALQVCGWFAAYLGSALTTDEPLKFRNLGGSADRLRPVDRSTGTLATHVRITRVAHSAGMIIQRYEFETSDRVGPVYRGETHFGFFREQALAEQVGIRDATLYVLSADQAAKARSFSYPREAPFPDDRWRMVERIDAFAPSGGPHGLGFIEGSTGVDPNAWFFQAHFHQDPVWPGSLGLESFLQLLKVVATERWGTSQDARFQTVCAGGTHRWVYRGQIIPSHDRVTIQAVITHVDDRTHTLKADGLLGVGGRVIYQMNDFTLSLSAGA